MHFYTPPLPLHFAVLFMESAIFGLRDRENTQNYIYSYRACVMTLSRVRDLLLHKKICYQWRSFEGQMELLANYKLNLKKNQTPNRNLPRHTSEIQTTPLLSCNHKRQPKTTRSGFGLNNPFMKFLPRCSILSQTDSNSSAKKQTLYS